MNRHSFSPRQRLQHLCPSSWRFVFVFLALAFVVSGGRAAAQIPLDYYDSVDDSTSASLRATLNDVVTAGFSGIPFDSNPDGIGGTDASFNALYRIDADHVDPDYVRLLYSNDRRIGDEAHTGDGDPATGGWNREHAFPKSFYDAEEPMAGDFLALFPCDADINTQRNTKAYDVVAAPSYTDVFGNKADNKLFEPIDSMKGDVARAVFYMDVRYEGELVNAIQEPNLYLIDAEPSGTGADEMAYLQTLLEWHNADPPDPFEATRNQRAYEEQGNANPFVDHPEWVQILYGSAAPSVSDGDTVTIGGEDLVPVHLPHETIEPGMTDVPFLAMTLDLAANEFDLGAIDILQGGSAPDASVASVKLWQDRDADNALSLGDILLADTAFAGGGATMIPVAPLRLEPGQTRLLLTASIDIMATVGDTVQLSFAADGLLHSIRGGADVSPTYGAISATSVTIGPPPMPPDLIAQESFESPVGAGYTIVPAPAGDDATNYFGRFVYDAEPITTPSGLSTELAGVHPGDGGGFGGHFIAGEDTNSSGLGLPSDGIHTTTIDPVDVTGATDLQVIIALNAKETARYDSMSLSNGDYLQVFATLDAGERILVGQFTGVATEPVSNSRLGRDVNLDGLAEAEISDYSRLEDYRFVIPALGDSLTIEIVTRFESGDEEIVFDNVRVMGVAPEEAGVAGWVFY